jgi:hypothetical protein
MSNYIVQVDALGFNGGVARKGETVTTEQVGADNVARLVTTGAIISDAPVTNAQPATPQAQPETLQTRFSVGLPPEEGHELTDEEKAWALDVKAGIVPVPFDADKVADLTIKVIKERIVALGAEAPADGKKAEYIEALGAAVEAFFVNWEIE